MSKIIFICFFFLFICITLSLYTDSVSYGSCRKQSVAIKYQKEQEFPKGRKGYIIGHVCA